MTAIANLPDLRPSLLLDFANSGRVDPRIQCTRASSATCFGPDGKLRTVAANVPRIDYDPVTGKCLGLLVEEARTNTGTPLIASGSVPQVPTYTYNSDLPPLVAGRVPARNYAVGAVDASSAAGARANIRADPSGLTENTTYTASIYVCGVKDGATRATMYFTISGITALSTTVDLVVGAWRRLVLTITLPAGVSGTGALRVAGSGGADPLQPFGVDGYQFEVGAFPTSYIPTEASAVTRAADKVSLPPSRIPDLVSFDKGFTVFVSGEYRQSPAVLVQLDNGSASNRILIESSSGVRAQVVSGGVSGFSKLLQAPMRTNKVAFGVSAASTNFSVNGVASSSSTIAVPAVNRITLGGRSFDSLYMWNSTIEHVAVYPIRLSDSQLQRLTA